LRIIGGKYKGRSIASGNYHARPTTDFARESLFNILNNYFNFDEIKVLDLFAGTGAISFEFASRGCEQIDLIESDYKNYSLICNEAKKLDIRALRPVKADVFRYIEKCITKYDIIFADPPYDMKGVESIPNLIFEKAMLKPDGWFILEHSKSCHFNEHQHFKEERKYGAVHFSIFRSAD
jgi:16S rRNA (guanine(966)-N(2))-methyltransferase RsmD